MRVLNLMVVPLVVGGLSIGVSTPAPAQDDGSKRVLEIGKWYPELEGGLNLTQSAYSDNWAGGDKGSIVWTLIANARAENKLSEKMHWDNTLKLAFGQTHGQSTDDRGGRSWDRPEKSTDLIDFESLMRFTLGSPIDPFVAVGVSSQFQDASDELGRNISFNPITISETVGIAHVFIDEEERSLQSRLGFAFHQNIRRFFDTSDPADDFTIYENSSDGGVEWITEYDTKVLEDRVTWATALRVYQPVFYSAQDDFDAFTAADLTRDVDGVELRIPSDVADYTLAADVAWENIFSTQITKIIAVSLYTQLVYDKYDNTVVPIYDDAGALTDESAIKIEQAVRKKGQFKQTLALGLTYRFL